MRLFEWLVSFFADGLIAGIVHQVTPAKILHYGILLIILLATLTFLYLFFLLNVKAIVEFSSWGKALILVATSVLSLAIAAYLFFLLKREWRDKEF